MISDQTVPGVLVRVYAAGVLITGESGSGKSELALGLMNRGHRLVADDAVTIRRTEHGLVGRCPEGLAGRIEIRGLGILTVKALYTDQRTIPEAAITLEIQLIRPETGADWAAWPRLHGHWGTATYLGRRLPRLTLPTDGRRPLPLLVETAVRAYFGEEVPDG